jgi:hypothetical protein
MFTIIPRIDKEQLSHSIKKHICKRPVIKFPDMLVKLYPHLCEEEFSGLIKDKYWLQNVVKICESCIFELAKQSPLGGVFELGDADAQIRFNGVGPLDPKKIKDRTEKTQEGIRYAREVEGEEAKVKPACCYGSAWGMENKGNYEAAGEKPGKE